MPFLTLPTHAKETSAGQPTTTIASGRVKHHWDAPTKSEALVPVHSFARWDRWNRNQGLASRSLTLRSLFLLYQVPKPCPSQESGSRLYAPQNKKGRNLRNIRFQLAENHLSLRIHSRNGNVPYLEPLIFPKGVKNRLTNKTWYSTVAAALKSCGPFLPLLAAVFCI